MITARPLVRDLEASKIREVSVAGAGIEGVLPLWFGEPDIVTPQFIRDAAARVLAGRVGGGGGGGALCGAAGAAGGWSCNRKRGGL